MAMEIVIFIIFFSDQQEVEFCGAVPIYARGKTNRNPKEQETGLQSKANIKESIFMSQ